jgi:hypothetical protein
VDRLHRLPYQGEGVLVPQTPLSWMVLGDHYQHQRPRSASVFSFPSFSGQQRFHSLLHIRVGLPLPWPGDGWRQPLQVSCTLLLQEFDSSYSHLQTREAKDGPGEEGLCGGNCRGGRVEQEDLLSKGERWRPQWVGQEGLLVFGQAFKESEKQHDCVVLLWLVINVGLCWEKKKCRKSFNCSFSH